MYIAKLCVLRNAAFAGRSWFCQHKVSIVSAEAKRSDRMRLRPLEFISTDAIRGFISAGGRLQYIPLEERDWTWALMAIHPSGERMPVYNGRSGQPRIFQTADSIVRFHRKYFPEDKSVSIPYPHGDRRSSSKSEPDADQT